MRGPDKQSDPARLYTSDIRCRIVSESVAKDDAHVVTLRDFIENNKNKKLEYLDVVLRNGSWSSPEREVQDIG